MRLLHTLLAFVVLAALAAAEPVHLIFLHTNDVHGQVLPRRAHWVQEREVHMGGLPRVAAYVNEVRAEVARSGAGLFVVDAGDWFTGTPEGAVDGGVPFVAALTAVGYDAMCVGNHEFDLGLDGLRRVLARARPPAVLANVRDGADGPRVGWAPAYRVVERAGVRVGFVGLVAEETPEITHRDAGALHFADPAAELARARAELGDAVDLVVPLTHLGIGGDTALARAHPDLPLVIGGHSHSYLNEPVVEGTTRVVQAGDKATVVGRVDLWWDAEAGRALSVEARLVELEEDPDPAARDDEVEARCADLLAESAASMDEVVGRLAAAAAKGAGARSGSLGNLIADSFLAAAPADVAIHNRGGIRRALPAGPVTRRDLFEVLPFANTVVTVELTGAELRETVRRAVEGVDHSGIEVAGMTPEVAIGADGAIALRDLRVGGAAVDPAGTYVLATNSFLADGGDGYLVPLGDRPRRDTGLVLRDLLERTFRGAEVVRAPEEDRYDDRSGGSR